MKSQAQDVLRNTALGLRQGTRAMPETEGGSSVPEAEKIEAANPVPKVSTTDLVLPDFDAKEELKDDTADIKHARLIDQVTYTATEQYPPFWNILISNMT